MTDDPNGHAAELAAELEAELDATDDVLGRSLADLLAPASAHLSSPPADLESRTHSQVTTNLMSRSLLGAGSDLLTVGWQTVRLLFSQTDEAEGPESEVTP